MFRKSQKAQPVVEFILKPDYNEVKDLLLAAEAQKTASFDTEWFSSGPKYFSARYPGGSHPAEQIGHLVCCLHSCWYNLNSALTSLYAARSNFGTLKGKRAKKAASQAEQTDANADLQYGLAAGLVQYKLQIEAVEGQQTKFDQVRTDLMEAMQHFEHGPVHLLLMHNIMCMQDLSDRTSAYVASLSRVDGDEYSRLTAWITQRWSQFVERFAPSK